MTLKSNRHSRTTADDLERAVRSPGFTPNRRPTAVPFRINSELQTDRKSIFNFSLQRRIFIALAAIIALCGSLCIASPLHAEESTPVAESAADPDSRRFTEAPDVASRAWEWRPYQVAAWICTDGSPELGTVARQLCHNVETQTELLDPSGWDVNVRIAPAKWRWQFLETIVDGTMPTPLPDDPELAFYDKLMVVCIRVSHGHPIIEVRELDLQTGQWGPVIQGPVANIAAITAQTTRFIGQAFMPITNVDKVVENRKENEDVVVLRSRAVNACLKSQFTPAGELEIVSNLSSPCYIRPTDRLLPVIRRTDRQGNLLRIEPIEFTFLTVKEIAGPEVKTAIHSMFRAPLSGRTSKRAEKLALVVRPPARPSVLRLISRDKDKRPLEGFEIWSRSPNDPKEAETQLLGKTDWRGEMIIPPSDDGLRLILVKRGQRKLAKVPIIAGFRDEFETSVPNDETRLYAEGVIRGLESEILNTVIQRKISEQDIEAALDKNKPDEASSLLRKYQELETPQDIKARLSDEEIRLKSQTSNEREFEYIQKMFATLRGLLNSQVLSTSETELQERLQKMLQNK